MIQAVIVNSVFFHFFRKYCPQYYFSAILLYFVGYYCYFNMEILREILCICILMLITSWLLDKKWLLYYAGCAVAIYIHYSAAIMLVFPLLFVFFKKPSWKWQLLIMGGIIVVLNVVNIAAILVSALSLNEQLTLLVEKYMEYQSNLTGMLSQLIVFLPILGMIYIRERYDLQYHDKFVPIAMGVVFAFAMAMGFAGFARFVNYFVPYILVLTVHTVYYFISHVKFLYSQVTYLVLAASLSVLFFNYSFYYMRDMSEYYPATRFGAIFVPYHSVFDPVVEDKREKFIENYRDIGIFF